ncbi:hypothetical protein CBR_g786 [Chara braunii]|uniref:Protein kinase domain-containing protein n=1 Tax=Chara braunii TaxID=69332 RepID=A0A388KC72_CHABU|nr:hypothetical protein CBR_g786 [Chara braunii]|eukprot:GBG67658.1 hypothetical protein CBR_g786 [Chara braunii]
MGCVCSNARDEPESPNPGKSSQPKVVRSVDRDRDARPEDGQKHPLDPTRPSKVEVNGVIVAPHLPSTKGQSHHDTIRSFRPDKALPLAGSAVSESVAAGWPSWLSTVAAEAIRGWVPRKADSFEKIEKIGQGTYSNVYKARDLEDGQLVALKKVRFDNMEPESVRFMAREIEVLRKLDHPNIVRLKGLVTSRVSCSLYLVFEYMEHDLAGLAACPGVQFHESQIKCYMQQLLRGLEHCHIKGVLHRDIKGSNLLLDNKGNLKIADFGLATFYRPDANVPLTSRVVTLWYRPPELLLGATNYGAAVDLWSTGCILAELIAGKPIMPGRTEVEQLHKIFKLCGSPSEEYWRKSKLPHATMFKPQQPYKRSLSDVFKDFPPTSLALLETLLAIEPGDRGTSTSALKSDFFNTKPLPCEPSSLPEYPPSKEYDAKLRDEEARRNRLRKVEPRNDNRRQAKVRLPHIHNAELDTSLTMHTNRMRLALSSSKTSKSDKFPPLIEHSAGLIGLGPHAGQLPGERRDSSPRAAPRVLPSSKSGPQPMVKPGTSGAALWGLTKDDERLPPGAPLPPPRGRPAKSITVPDLPLHSGYPPAPPEASILVGQGGRSGDHYGGAHGHHVHANARHVLKRHHHGERDREREHREREQRERESHRRHHEQVLREPREGRDRDSRDREGRDRESRDREAHNSQQQHRESRDIREYPREQQREGRDLREQPREKDYHHSQQNRVAAVEDGMDQGVHVLQSTRRMPLSSSTTSMGSQQVARKTSAAALIMEKRLYEQHKGWPPSGVHGRNGANDTADLMESSNGTTHLVTVPASQQKKKWVTRPDGLPLGTEKVLTTHGHGND